VVTLNEQKILGISKSWLSVACGALFYCYQFVLRVSPNVMNNELLHDFSIDATTFGTMIAFYSWSYAGVQIPLGIALDRFGPGRLLTVASLICASSCFLFSLSTSPYLASFSLFIMGLGSACGFLGSIKLGTVWFPPSHLARVIAVIMIFGTVGAGLGGSPLSMLTDYLGWQATMQFLGCVGIVIAFFMYLIVGRTPVTLVYEPTKSVFAGLKRVLKSPQAWLISIYSMLMYTPIIIMGVAWGVPFILSAYEVDEKLAATVITTMFVGAAIGSPFFSMLSDKMKRRNQPMLIGAVASFVLYCLILFIPNVPLPLMYVLFFAAGFSYTAKSLSFTSICEIMPQSSSAVAVGFINTITMATGALFHPLMGKMLVSHWDGSIVDGVVTYSLADYQFALAIIPFCLGLSILVIRYIKETHHAHELTEMQKGAAVLSDVE
jgi:sugar phosphate permease